MPKIILGLVGPLASGKEVTKKYLEEQYKASSYRFSTMLRDILNRLYLPISRENMQNLSLDLRQRFQGDVLAKVIAKDVERDTNSIVVIDGVRRLDDISHLKNLPGFFLVSIDASPEIRYKRMLSRNENSGDDQKTFNEFLADGNKEAEQEITAVMQTSKYHLNNDGSLPDLYKQIEEIIAQEK